MKLNFILPLLLLFFNFAFSQETEVKKNNDGGFAICASQETGNGKIENGVYICNRFDWQIKIPLNYQITDISKTEALQKKGSEQNAPQKSPHLVGFGIDPRNNFTASFESLAGSKITSLEEHKKSVLKLLSDTFTPIPTLKFEASSDNVTIGKYNFYKIRTKLFDSKTNELLLTQDLYNTFIDNHLFSVNINFANPVIGKMLTDNFVESLTK